MTRSVLVAAAATVALSTAASAHCAFENDVPVSLIANAFDAWKIVGAAMSECGNVTAEHSNEFISKQGVAFEQRESLYQLGGVANSSIQPLLGGGLLRPLDDLVDSHGASLTPNQLIRYDGQIMAIAMMVNTQHIMYREDLFTSLGLQVPTNVAELTAVAEALRASGEIEYPFGAAYESGWNLGAEFVNLYLGNGGTFFADDGSAAVNNDIGTATLAEMAQLTAYMDPEFLLSDSAEVIRQLQQGDIAIATLWADSAGAVNAEGESRFPGQIKTAAALMGAERPAATLWWDGIVLAKNQTEEEAEAAFKVALEGIDRQMAQANPDAAIWIIDGAPSSDLATGAKATAAAGALPYPASLPMGLLHDVIGTGLAPFFTGQQSAEEALAAIESAYDVAAKEAGFLQ
ncbi:MAG: extracellular solute-binding protein [Pseudomonadota bacterium]